MEAVGEMKWVGDAPMGKAVWKFRGTRPPERFGCLGGRGNEAGTPTF